MWISHRILLCLTFGLIYSSSTLLANQEDKSWTWESFINSVQKTYTPPSDGKRGVLDGNRQPPVHVNPTSEQLAGMKKIHHLIIIFQENWSFDGLYGKLPGVNGLANASKESQQQVDLAGNPYPHLLVCVDTKQRKPYPQIPLRLPNAPFDLQPYLSEMTVTGDLVHHFYQEQYQINGGKMNAFAAWSNAGGFVMSYYDASQSPMGTLAKEFVICDNWFHSCYGGSMCGALWLFAAQMPTWPQAPEEIVAHLLPSGIMVRDGLVSSDGYAINDAQPFYWPYHPKTPDSRRVPPQAYETIGDRLTQKGISWGWYAEGWNDALAGKADSTFAFHHQAPVYFKQFAPGTKARAEHLFDLKQFDQDLDNKALPSVTFIRSLDRHSEHPGDGPLQEGLAWCANLIKKIQQSPIWNDCVIIVTYDENGGRWDHVSPPVVDRFGPGTRVPAIIISPFSKKGFIDHTAYETVSILKFIEQRWGLQPLSDRDATANNILNAFDF